MSWIYIAIASVFVLGGCLGTLLSALMFAAATMRNASGLRV